MKNAQTKSKAKDMNKQSDIFLVRKQLYHIE